METILVVLASIFGLLAVVGLVFYLYGKIKYAFPKSSTYGLRYSKARDI
jgi:hypothetical protein